MNLHRELSQVAVNVSPVSSSEKEIDRVNENQKDDTFNTLFRRYNQLVRSKYWFVDVSSDPSETTPLPLLCNQYTFPILIVDDNPDIVFLMKMVFDRITPTITATFLPNGNELIDTLQKAPVLPRIILLDLFMEPSNGFEILNKIRTHAIYKHLPIVIFTASVNEDDRRKALALGADEFLIKPYTFNQTLATINLLVERWL